MPASMRLAGDQPIWTNLQAEAILPIIQRVGDARHHGTH